MDSFYRKTKVPRNVFYTEDNIPVRTVYISGLSMNTIESQLYQYFMKFGEIETLRIHQNIRNKYSFAFITFATNQAAAKVITIRRHTIYGKHVYASMADSWHQPKLSQQQNDDESIAKQEPVAGPSTTILALNDDCLLHICDYLNLVDITKLGQTCNRFKSFVEINIYRKYSLLDLDHLKNVSVTKTLSLMELRSIFKNMREHIQQLHSSCWNISTSHDRFFHMVQKCLNNLQELHLKELKLSKNAFRTFSNSFIQLKVLYLRKCQGLGDAFFQFTPNVVDLRLNHIADFCGRGLKHLKHLEKLSIKYCTNLNCKTFLNYLRDNQQIVRLTLKGYVRPLPKCSGFEIVISNLKSLEYLCSDWLKNWPLQKLDSLKSLNSANCVDKAPSLKGLADKDQLEELDISWCIKFADKEANLHKYLLSFTKLKILNLNYTSFIDQELLLKLVEKLDLTLLGCDSVTLTDDATVQLVELSKSLELFCYTSAKLPAIRKIVELVNNDPNRPKLVFIADIDENEKTNVLNGINGRVQILDAPPEFEDGYHDYDENLDDDFDSDDNLNFMHDDYYQAFELLDDESDFELDTDCYSDDDFDYDYGFIPFFLNPF